MYPTLLTRIGDMDEEGSMESAFDLVCGNYIIGNYFILSAFTFG